MNACEFCAQLEDGDCRLRLKMPKNMTCREFEPTLDKFCANESDFVNPKQLVEMAVFFGIKGPELKKVRLMAAREENARL